MTDSPAYVMLASHGKRVIAFGHADDLETAFAWCEEAREVFLEQVSQVAIAEGHHAHATTGGSQTMLVPLEGWIRRGAAWHPMTPPAIKLDYHELGPGPTTLDQLSALLLRPAKQAQASRTTTDTELHRVAGLLVRLSHGVRALAAVARANTQTRRRALIVDDDNTSRAALAQALSEHHEVTETDGFASALLELALWDFDTIVADHDLGVLANGTELLIEVRNRWPQMRRVLCTGVLSELEQTLAENVAHQLIRKPVDRALLLASVAAS